MFGIDSTTPIDATTLRDNHVGFICRYVPIAGNPKSLTAAEVRLYKSAGIKLVVVYEAEANRALKGYGTGKGDAINAQARCDALGLQGIPIYFAVDFDATPRQQAAINAYLEGATDAIGHNRVGVYGGFYVVKRALDAGVCKYAWQTYAWSGGQWDARAQIQQYKNGQHLGRYSVDFNRSMHSDYGQWTRAVPLPPKPAPVPTPLPKPIDLSKIPTKALLAELARRLKPTR